MCFCISSIHWCTIAFGEIIRVAPDSTLKKDCIFIFQHNHVFLTAKSLYKLCIHPAVRAQVIATIRVLNIEFEAGRVLPDTTFNTLDTMKRILNFWITKILNKWNFKTLKKFTSSISASVPQMHSIYWHCWTFVSKKVPPQARRRRSRLTKCEFHLISSLIFNF
jgi:hypothetical protein